MCAPLSFSRCETESKLRGNFHLGCCLLSLSTWESRFLGNQLHRKKDRQSRKLMNSYFFYFKVISWVSNKKYVDARLQNVEIYCRFTTGIFKALDLTGIALSFQESVNMKVGKIFLTKFLRKFDVEPLG